MDDPVLARAKALIALTKNVDSAIGAVTTHHPYATITGKEDCANDDKITEKGKMRSFRASVIKGSSLVNTHDDIREFVSRGEAIIIDGTKWVTAVHGQWTSNTIQLTGDYGGDTNFSAVITLVGEEASRASPRKSRKKQHMVPVPSSEIISAVGVLDEVRDILSNLHDTADITGQQHGARGGA